MFGFAEDTKDMTAAEILNYYRNRYYAEPQVTERGIVANAINDYFKESASKSEWISVDERLHERDVPVLVYKNRFSDAYGNMETAYFDGKRWRGSCGEVITHWMPLPEPPKGELYEMSTL